MFDKSEEMFDISEEMFYKSEEQDSVTRRLEICYMSQCQWQNSKSANH